MCCITLHGCTISDTIYLSPIMPHKINLFLMGLSDTYLDA